MTNILLATSNGTGMGHLTRQAAVALASGDEDSPTLFSLSIGLPLAMGLGIAGEYCPSHDRPWIASSAWNSYLRDRLIAIIEETACDVVLFDGVAAYPGIGKTSSALREVAFVWLRRGMWRPGANPKQLRRADYFDMVIEPGDLAGDADRGPTAAIPGVTRVAPISLIEVLSQMTREEARRALGLPVDREIALVTLGSGRLGDVAGPGQVALSALLESSDLHVAITRSAVARNEVPVSSADRVTIIRDLYPLLPYFPAFDLAVSSAGYNAVHELIPSGLPTLFVANTSTRTDDQTTRAMRIAELGIGLQAPDDDPAQVGAGVKRLLDPGLRRELGSRAAATRPRFTGADETGRLVTGHARAFTRRRPRPSVAVSEIVQKGKDLIKDTLGEERTNTVKRVLGREPSVIAHRTAVRVGEPTDSEQPIPLLVTEDLSRDLLAVERPLEHLLPGSSAAYREHRMELIRAYYDVVD
jgi:hypothetical protein